MASNARTASLLVLLQLGSRLVTFTLNQALLSYTTPAAFGTAAVQLEPLLNTVLFLCREGIRGAIARQSKDTISSSEVKKLSLLPLALGLPLALAGFSLYARNTSVAVYQQDFFVPSVFLYALSAITELASEPHFNRAQLDLDVKLRVSIEGTAVIARAITTLLFVLYGRERYALLAFGAGQLAYALTLCIRYSWHYRGTVAVHESSTKQLVSLYQTERLSLTILTCRNTSSKDVTKLAYALTKQSFIKQVLTEGDKIIVSRISPIEDQGGYGLALNYGTLTDNICAIKVQIAHKICCFRVAGGSCAIPAS